MKSTIARLLFISIAALVSGLPAIAQKVKQFYEIKLYHLKSKEQEERMDKYLKEAYLPALHKAGIAKIGVFKPVGMDTVADRRIYVLIPLKNMDQSMQLDERLSNDQTYASAGSDYIDAAYNNSPYQRLEVIFLEAFDEAPQMNLPQLKGPMSDRIYELRSYEGATEKLHRNKVSQFNAGGEVKLFKRLGFNAVFYARVIAGSHMPNLMYMTTFENRAVRDEHWKTFSADTEWKDISTRAEYKNNVSRNDTQFLFPADYSDY